VQDNNSYYYQAEYVYDVNGTLSTRKVGVNVGSFSVTTSATPPDALGRFTHLEHQFTGGMTGATRTFDYVYDTMGNRTSIQRDGNTPETYGYDFGQAVTTGMDGGNAHTYGYDANGNRTAMNGSGSYVTNFLNQQTTFNGQTVSYANANGNVTSIGGAASYVYDAQNRLTSVSNGTTTTFNYDGLNRKISQTVGGATTYNVWDGWSLIEERGAGNALLNSYVYGAGEILERITGTTAYFYYQDGLGSTSHVSDSAGNLLESYQYGTFGQFSVYDPDGGLLKNGSAYDIRHLFTGQLWMPQSGLYDYRNRVFSPTLTRFLQPDPIGFGGDPSNLYRYCGNDSVNRDDPMGLLDRGGGHGKHPPVLIKPRNGITDPVVVTGSWVPGADDSWRDLGRGMPDNFGTFSSFGGISHGGTGGIRYTATFSRDSNQLRTTPSQTFASSTQGWWTTLEGLSTGSSWVINLQVQTAIEGAFEGGVKSFQSLTFNMWGQIISHWATVGSTSFGLFNVHGSGSFSASVWSAGGRYLANMTGSAQTILKFPPIDYSFNFSGSFGGGTPTLSGTHDGYPSYTVWANGQQLYYRHETGWPSALGEPMEIIVGH